MFFIMNKFRDLIVNSVSHLDAIYHLSQVDVDALKVQGAYNNVRESLTYYCPESTFSELMVHQLAMVHSHKFLELQGKCYPYIYTELLERMRRVEENKPSYKPFKGEGSPLVGWNLYHVHHSLNFEVIFNFKRYLEDEYPNDKSIYQAIQHLEESSPERNDHIAMFVHSELLKSFEWGERNKTGEWMVYQLIEGKVHFLALSLHEVSDEDLFERIRPHLKSHIISV